MTRLDWACFLVVHVTKRVKPQRVVPKQQGPGNNRNPSWKLSSRKGRIPSMKTGSVNRSPENRDKESLKDKSHRQSVNTTPC